MFKSRTGADLVAVILALSIAVSVFLFAIALLVEVIDHNFISEIPPNSSQVLTAIYGGIIGILGGYVGYGRATRSNEQTDRRLSPPEDSHDPAA